MASAASSSSGCNCNRGRAVLPVTASLVFPFLLLLLVVSCPAALVVSATHTHGHGHGGGKHATAGAARAAFRAGDEREAYARIMARMARMDKDSNMTIQVPSLPCSCYSAPSVCARAALPASSGFRPSKRANPPPRCRLL
jgi:hypothetical protein